MTQYEERILFTIRDISSPEDCQKLCANHPQCVFFMQQVATRVCRLMETRTSDPPRRSPRFPFVSGPRSCRLGEHSIHTNCCTTKEWDFVTFLWECYKCTLQLKQFSSPPSDTPECDDGWQRFGNSCYRAAGFAFLFANEAASACRFLRVDGAVPAEPRTQEQLNAIANIIEVTKRGRDSACCCSIHNTVAYFPLPI